MDTESYPTKSRDAQKQHLGSELCLRVLKGRSDTELIEPDVRRRWREKKMFIYEEILHGRQDDGEPGQRRYCSRVPLIDDT